MFTGIVTEVGVVRSISKHEPVRLVVSVVSDTETVKIGASICCSGVCLTVVEKGKGWFAVEVSNETLSRTTIGLWNEGTRINLEKSLLVGDEMGGHIVSGHVDGIAQLRKTTPDGSSMRMLFEAPQRLSHLIAEKGSIAIDGVSLTINKVLENKFEVNIVGHTRMETTLDSLYEGNSVNLEIDMLARYVERFLEGKNDCE